MPLDSIHNMQEFSIKDLENYTGIKAHTIRIWEQRYGLLKPSRTDSNIRKYSDHELKTLLNISLLNQRGHKISEIAGMKEEEIARLIEQYSLSVQNDDTMMATLKLAMLNFDEKLFNSVVDLRIASHGMEHTFHHVLSPFLQQIGILWMTNTICPAQEHFISNLIRQKLYAQINNLSPELVTKHNKTFVLYLPELEFHEISMIMLNFTLRSRGFRTVFLGQSVPLEDLYQIYQRIGDVHFISQFTTQPAHVLLPAYMKKIAENFRGTDCVFHFTGVQTNGLKSPEVGLIEVHADLGKLLESVTAS